MSVSGGLIGDSTDAGKGFFANDNFIRTGSRHYQSSSNLVVGENFSGSLAEIRTWSSALSKSKFEQHTFNKFAAVGNDVNSYKNELIYRFKLNENYVSSSVSSSAASVFCSCTCGLLLAGLTFLNSIVVPLSNNIMPTQFVFTLASFCSLVFLYASFR